MSGGGTQQSLRKALGAIKDSTRVGLAKVNSDYKVINLIVSGYLNSLIYKHDTVWLSQPLTFFSSGIGCCNCKGYKPC